MRLELQEVHDDLCDLYGIGRLACCIGREGEGTAAAVQRQPHVSDTVDPDLTRACPRAPRPRRTKLFRDAPPLGHCLPVV